MAFFGMQGNQSDKEDGTWSFAANFGFHLEIASNNTKGKVFEAHTAALFQADTEAVPLSALQSRSHDNHESFADVESTETTCALFWTILADARQKSIEMETTFCQTNWCHVHLTDKTAQACTNDDARLWMLVTG